MTGFVVIQPQAIDDAHLVSSNVVETAPAAWSSGTTYALNATSSVAVGAGALDVYTSLQPTNLNHAPASSPTWWKKTGSTYQTYAAQAAAAGDRVLVTSNHTVYEAVKALAAPSPDPTADDGTNWLEVRASNRWASFDLSNSSQTSNPDSVVQTVRADGIANGVAATNVNAATVRVRQIDDVEGVVFDETYDMVSTSGITDFYPWFFSPPVRKTDLAVVELYPYADAQIEVTFAAPGEDAAVGTLVVGEIRELGGVQWGAQPGFVDNSQINQNGFGDYEIVKRSFARIGQYTINVDNDDLDETLRFFEDNRALPLLFQGDPRWGATVVFGIVGTCQPTIRLDTLTECALTLKGFP